MHFVIQSGSFPILAGEISSITGKIKMRFNRREKICYPVFATFAKDGPGKKIKWKRCWKIWLAGAVLIFILAGMIYLAFWSPFFKITKIEVKGANFVSGLEIEKAVRDILQQKIFGIISRDNLFTWSVKDAENKILSSFPVLRKVEIKRISFQKIEVLVDERETAAVWCRANNIEPVAAPTIATSANEEVGVAESTLSAANERRSVPQGEQCFVIDKEGIIFRETPEISGSLMVTFYGSNNNAVPGLQVIASSTVNFASRLKKEMSTIGLETTAFIPEDSGQTDLSVLMAEGWWVYFSQNRPPLTQLRVLQALLAEEIKDKRAALQYIDLRITDRVYYK